MGRARSTAAPGFLGLLMTLPLLPTCAALTSGRTLASMAARRSAGGRAGAAGPLRPRRAFGDQTVDQIKAPYRAIVSPVPHGSAAYAASAFSPVSSASASTSSTELT